MFIGHYGLGFMIKRKFQGITQFKAAEELIQILEKETK